MGYLLTKENIRVICELQTLASEMTCDEFEEFIKHEYNYREGVNMVDFDYHDLTATYDKFSKCLCGCFDIWDEEGDLCGTFHCEKVLFKQ